MPKVIKKESGKYFEATGRRKESVARVRITAGEGAIEVNGKSVEAYFPTIRLQKAIRAPLLLAGANEKLNTTIRVAGGGITGQAEAARLAIARALVLFSGELKKKLRKDGYLTRDARVVERKKYGLKKARRAPQWQKR